MNKTYLPTTENLDQKWYVIDAADQRLGRLATEVASILRGKNKATFTPHMDTGDFVVVVNAEKIDVTGKKREQKLYRRHSGRPGGMKEETFGKLQARLPERIIEQAIKGMLPDGKVKDIMSAVGYGESGGRPMGAGKKGLSARMM